MNFNIEKRTNYTLIEISNKLDCNVSPYIRSELVTIFAGGEKNIIIDLEKCTYCDSSGISLFLIFKRMCQHVNGILIISRLNDMIKTLINTMQLTPFLNIANSIERAEEMLETANN